MRLLLIISALLCSLSLKAQDSLYSISGKITNLKTETLPGTQIDLLQGDSNLLSGFTDGEGQFELDGIPNGLYQLQAYFLGYAQLSLEVEIQNKSVDLGVLTLKDDIEALEGVTVVGEVQAVRQDGDTSTFNANAYKVNPDATAEDLVRKLPGVDMSDGNPKAQGENITKVLVDGKPFFGDDVNASLKNIPAEMISGIQIYDERSEQSQFSGFDDGSTTKTLNIVTREDRRQGKFGKVYAGYGFPNEHFFNVGGSLNIFKGNERITILGQTNNINIQNFNNEDLGGGGGGRGRGGRGGGGNNEMTVSPKGGITQTNALGLNYINQWDTKFKISGSYFFNNAHNKTEELIERTYINEAVLGQKYRENNLTTSDETLHRLFAKLEYQIDTFNYIQFTPSLKIQQRKSQSSMDSRTFFDETQPINFSYNNYQSENLSINGDYRLLFNHQFLNPRRTFSLFNMSGFSRNNGNNELVAENHFEDTSLVDYTNQHADLNTKNWNTYVNLNYTEPLSVKFTTQVNAGIRYQNSQTDKKTFDFNTGNNEYTDLNQQLSNEFLSHYTTPFAGLALGYKDSNMVWNVGANMQYALLKNERILPIEDTFTKSFKNILPYAMFTYNLGKGSSIRLRYRASTNTPSVNQLQDVLDNSNPLILRTGNPDLDQTRDHRLFANYRTSNLKYNSTFFAMVMASFTQDYIANSTFMARNDTTVNGVELGRGMQYIQPVNLDGYYRLMANSSYGFRLKPLKSNLNFSLRLSTQKTPGMINNQLNYAQSNSLGGGISLSSLCPKTAQESDYQHFVCKSHVGSFSPFF